MRAAPDVAGVVRATGADCRPPLVGGREAIVAATPRRCVLDPSARAGARRAGAVATTRARGATVRVAIVTRFATGAVTGASVRVAVLTRFVTGAVTGASVRVAVVTRFATGAVTGASVRVAVVTAFVTGAAAVLTTAAT